VNVGVSERCGDQAAGAADDEVGQGAAEPGGVDVAGRVGRDRRTAAGAVEAAVHPGDEVLDIGVHAVSGTGLLAGAAAASRAGQAGGEQQLAAGDVLQDGDRPVDRCDDHPRPYGKGLPVCDR
jgi:hypothetical protein